MAFTTRELTKAGFIRREDLDFRDDGTSFRGFEYKGMPITYTKVDGIHYLCIRVDYLKHTFTFKEWAATDEFQLTDKFNGVPEINTQQLVEVVERIIAKFDEMNKAAEEEEIPAEKIEQLVRSLTWESAWAEQVVKNFKEGYDWFNASEYTFRSLRDYAKSFLREAESAKGLRDRIASNDVEKRIIREYIEQFERLGYVRIARNDFYARKLREAIGEEV